MLKAKDSFKSMADSYVIFITESDYLRHGEPIYHIERVVRETRQQFGDGNHIIYVNGSYRNTENAIGKLVHDFQCPDPDKMFYSELADKVRHYKQDEGGRDNMCRIIEEYGDRRAAEAAKEAVKKVQEEARTKSIFNMMELCFEFGMTDEKILEKLMEKFDLSLEAASAYLAGGRIADAQ